MHSRVGPLAAMLDHHAHSGALAGSWPGLTVLRFTRPMRYRLDAVSLFVMVHDGRMWMTVAGGADSVDCGITDVFGEGPGLGMALQIDPRLVKAVLTTMQGRQPAPGQPDGGATRCGLSTVDDELAGIVVRFLRSLAAPSDRRVLAPLYLQEVIYRLLQGEHGARLIHLAAQQVSEDPIATVLDHISAHLGDTLSVDALAAQVNLSPSAFTRVFRGATGRSPYQYVKHTRLTRGRELLDGGRLGVTEVSRTVGYRSVSHFIKEFRSVFGETPGDYVNACAFSGRSAGMPLLMTS